MDFNLLVSDLGLKLTDLELDQFKKYYEVLVRENKLYNLTSITDIDGVYLKHFYDSLTLCKAINLSNIVEICDIGSGAGFPSIPLKIMFPNLQVTIIDSLKKRTDFITLLAKELKLEGVNVIWDRAENVKKKFDLVTARAVARLNILDELCIPLVKKNGYFMAMKGNSFQEELEEAQKGIKLLGGEVINCLNFQLPYENSERGIIVVKKIAETNEKYPRSFQAIKKKPL